jgi:hypothetical protein
VSVFRAIGRAFKAEFGKSRNTNPWPRCGGCYGRTEPAALCWHSSHGADICIGCCPHAGVHPEGEEK